MVVAAARLRQLFAAQPANDDSLKSAVWAYVDEMKNSGATVERTIVDIKRIAEAEGITAAPGHRLDMSASTPLSRAITWCIERYFEDVS